VAADVEIEVPVGGLDVEAVAEGRLELELVLLGRVLLLLILHLHPGGQAGLQLLDLELQLPDAIELVDFASLGRSGLLGFVIPSRRGRRDCTDGEQHGSKDFHHGRSPLPVHSQAGRDPGFTGALRCLEIKG